MFKSSKKFVLLIMITITVFLAGCGASNTSNSTTDSSSKSESTKNTAYPLKLKDSTNTEITIQSEPKKVVSLSPNVTETIYALNKQNILVGRTDFCTYPTQASKIPSVGTITDPSAEKIVELKPDVVIASNLTKPDILKKLQQLNIKVLTISKNESFENTYNNIENIGKIVNANKKAYSIVSNMKEKVKVVQEKVKGKSTPTVYYVVSYGTSGDFTAGKDTFVGKMIEMAGGKNAASDVTGWNYSLEKLVEKNPDILICSNKFNSKNGIKSTKGYKDLDAVKKNKLFEIDEDIISRQGPRLADGLEALAKIIHPEAF
ncbi:ABC transporter substrate-binding protein [Clostridium autoethanogenum]|uniref:ABC transporter substrate-binding protein n=2 Tax=Clostridium autoethanogenum TaxID=84023 RepID=A0A3M0STW3_9CLOT|nr:ABC transporter substrate-binding protein [Clostridium autoethanogenum]AGY76884.1 ABC transporter substrate-binding protein [Clostridium autoethanogenum DSM 10061]ALU37031.1 ABC-type transporter periplasmic subunit [Clostridium autoethanogenum DSM 10061]OVY48727.1 Hemin-binding periplasmic protein HmuT precursor [Clostridium autoethanogenum]RMD01874.1 ABC transporter substrate-binding protein [Clostridium autoethanogenum]